LVEFVTKPPDTPEGQLIRFTCGYAAKVEAKIRERSSGQAGAHPGGKLHNHGPNRLPDKAALHPWRRAEAVIVQQVFTGVDERLAFSHRAAAE
jgi:hypothetical protein